MKHLFKSFLSLVLLFTTAMAVASCGTGGCGSSGSFANGCTTKCDVTDCEDNCENQCCDDMFFCKTHFSPRSQGSDTARRLVASHLYEHQFDMDKLYGTFAVTLAFQRNFRKDELATYFSPKCDPCNPCIILGADNQSGVDVRSEDFGLSCTAEVCSGPKYSSFIADLQWWVGLSEWCPGTFFELYVPIVHTWVDYNCCSRPLKESKDDGCAETFQTGLMFSGDINENSDGDNVGTTDPSAALRGNFIWGDVERTMCFAKQCCNNIDKTRVADLQFNLGYDFWQTENYHLGLKVIFKAPTGNVAEGKFLLEPIVGNGGHFELGGGVTASAILWDKDIDQQVSWHLEADITHLFNSRLQRRVFDLLGNGCYSRYLLLKQFKKDGQNLVYSNLERGPNVFNQCLKVNAGAQVDITSLWSYRYTCWNADLAFNYWSRSQEKVNADSLSCCNIPDETYAIKGILNVTGAEANQTASKATIAIATETDGSKITDGGSPVFVGCQDLDICSGLAPSGNSFSVVGHFSYLMEDNEWEPYFGVGGKAEFSGRGNRAMNQWAVWAKGGITF